MRPQWVRGSVAAAYLLLSIASFIILATVTSNHYEDGSAIAGYFLVTVAYLVWMMAWWFFVRWAPFEELRRLARPAFLLISVGALVFAVANLCLLLHYTHIGAPAGYAVGMSLELIANVLLAIGFGLWSMPATSPPA